MRIIGCDLHTRQQTLAMLDTETGEVVKMTLTHSGSNVQEFYAALPGPVRVGIEATGTMQWFLSLVEELGIDCQVGHPAKIRAAEPRKQKHDRRDADLILTLLVENRFPAEMPDAEEAANQAKHTSQLGIYSRPTRAAVPWQHTVILNR
jgi:transposase